MNTGFLGHAVATVLTVYGIETPINAELINWSLPVATVLTVYGIETHIVFRSLSQCWALQQYLPFTVLKRRRCFIY